MVDDMASPAVLEIALDLFICFDGPEETVLISFVVKAVLLAVKACAGEVEGRMDFAVRRFLRDDVDDAASSIGAVERGSRALQDFNMIDRIHIGQNAQLRMSAHEAVRVDAHAVDHDDDVGRSVDCNRIGEIGLAGRASRRDNDARYLLHSIGNGFVMVSFNVLGGDDGNVGVRIDDLFRFTVGRDDDLVQGVDRHVLCMDGHGSSCCAKSGQ